MQLASIIDPDLVIHQLSSTSKKRLFETVAQTISERHPELTENAIFDGLFARERLGSTGIGEGVAVPHCRIESGSEDTCALITLEQPISFDAPDRKPVDLLVFLIVTGEACQDHLNRLAAVSQYFSNPEHRTALRAASDAQQLKELLAAA